MKSTILCSSFISVAEDCPVVVAQAPPARTPKSIPQIEFEMLIDSPYEFTSDEVLFASNGASKGVSLQEWLSKKQPDFRLSPLTQRYGWGVHTNAEGRVAIYAIESHEYRLLSQDPSLTQQTAYRSKSRRPSQSWGR